MPGPTVLALDVHGPVWEWRGPAPFYFVTVPDEESDAIHDLAAHLSYGWGCIPVEARIGTTQWTTALIPKDGAYLVPLKAAIRRAANVAVDDVIAVGLVFRAP